MIKKITFIFLIYCLLETYRKKENPEYKDPQQKAEKIIILTNKA